MFKRYLSIVIAILLLANQFGCSSGLLNGGKSSVVIKNDDIIDVIKHTKSLSEYTETDNITEENVPIIKFGKYYKDDLKGKNKEDLEWILLRKDENEAILCTKYIIDRKMYEESGTQMIFNDASISKWLNDDFYNIAFENENIIKDNKGCKVNLLDIKMVHSVPLYLRYLWVNTAATKYANRYFEKFKQNGKEYLRIKRDDINWYSDGFDTYYVVNGNYISNQPGTTGRIFNSDDYVYIGKQVVDGQEIEFNIENNYWVLDSNNEKKPFCKIYATETGIGIAGLGSDREVAKILNGVRPMIKIDLNANNKIKKEINKITKEYDIKEIVRNIKTIDKFNYDAAVDTLRTVKFGKYSVNGKEEDLSWIVLYRDNNRALLLSQYIIDEIEYINRDVGYEDINKWQYSPIRKWLNDDFYYNAFNDDEKSIILNEEIQNEVDVYEQIKLDADRYGYTYDGIQYDNSTYDKVFILSKEEIIKYFGYEPFGLEKKNDDDRVDFNYMPKHGAFRTNKIATKLLEDKKTLNNVDYWVRSRIRRKGTLTDNGRDIEQAVFTCSKDGWLMSYPSEVKIGVRPAIYIEYNDVYRMSVAGDYNFYINNNLQTNTWVDYLDDRYYVDENGFPIKNQFFEGQYLGSDGKLVRNRKMDDGSYVDFYGKIIDIKEDFDNMIKNEEIEVNTWHKTIGGLWYYFENDRENPKKGWYYEEKDNQTYYLDEETGIMATGWKEIDESLYYFNEQPAIIPNWYYIEAEDVWDSYGSDIKSYGSMFRNETTPDGKQVDENGRLID